MSTPTKYLKRQINRSARIDGQDDGVYPSSSAAAGEVDTASPTPAPTGLKMERRTMMETPLGDRDADTYPRSTIKFDYWREAEVETVFDESPSTVRFPNDGYQ